MRKACPESRRSAAGSGQEQVDERDQRGSDAGEDQGVIRAQIVMNVK